MSVEKTEFRTLKKRWLRYWRNPNDKSYMRELPPEDYEMNTVTTVNPYVYLDEIERAKKEKEYQAQVEAAQKRREMQATAMKKKEKVFIKEVNKSGGPGWYQDLSTRQGKRSLSRTQSTPSRSQKLYRSPNLNVLYKHDEERKERRKVIMGNLERLS